MDLKVTVGISRRGHSSQASSSGGHVFEFASRRHIPHFEHKLCKS